MFNIRCDSRGWFVTAEWMGVPDVPVFEPRNGDPWLDLMDCWDWVSAQTNSSSIS